MLDVLHAMGYGDGTEHSRLRTGGTGDAGIDGVIREDRLGLDVVYVQAKRWEATVGARSCKASSVRYRARERRRGSSSRLRPSRQTRATYAAGVSPRVILIDGESLAD